MSQSKKSEDTFTINLDESDTNNGTFITGVLGDSNYVFDTSVLYTSNITPNITWTNTTWPESTSIDTDEVERMCKEYPALEKTWRNFKATYDLVKQDWKGKQDGEDELPF